ncbi:hypothetical protein FACS189459_1440 [Bacilli bacterium]|nr:hypothetical protein FACS189459_1440 [Bacilli bacterium]
MLQQIIDLQNEAIDKVVSCLKTQDEVTFKSPTGSGKTHMMACIMNKMIGDKTIFIVSSLSKSGLAKQNHDAFVSKTNTLRNLIPFYIESETSSQEDIYINPNCNVYSLGRDLYKEKSKLARGAFKKFLNEITKVQHKKIILVKDECHQATNNLDKLREEYFSKVLNLSATPKFKPDVEITKQDAIVNKLIKNFESHDASDTGKSFDQAFEKFINLKANYIRGVNPCMIIQISNEKEG